MLCGSDPARFTSMDGRFSSPVFPGETLTIKAWDTGDGEAVFQTSGGDGRVVLDGGRCTFTA
jgi:acyl dehydratase